MTDVTDKQKHQNKAELKRPTRREWDKNNKQKHQIKQN